MSGITILLIRAACYLLVSIILWEMLPKEVKNKTYSEMSFMMFIGLIIFINIFGLLLSNYIIRLLSN
ncbi:hypothetical protein IMX26_05555 [Clostridium sp. 'deep sea']|uniref:hypothetical protein n=1 Tax=Clostridium sp. 'deep sea' TaxID=2779445 RepID=UPI0018966B60|nr:hypothetical protein [Clostridium sp. 'deep sea']QOR36279.1 hypothetical protein IMX26_05555 [Clostridium sp. 'deep sea']